MKKNNLLQSHILLLALLLSAGSIFTQSDQFRVLDPQRWGSEQGTIESAVFSLHPKGIYTEIGLYLTISGRGSYYSPGTQLEAVMDFSLPEEAIVHDSWLWVGDDIIRAMILDRWTASTIYEDIVNRRQDPSILTKESATRYRLRVYPLIMGEVRKLKITYLVPNTWTSEMVSAALPGHLLDLSRSDPRQVDILFWEDEQFKTPLLTGSAFDFVRQTDPELGEYLHLGFTNNDWKDAREVGFSNPMEAGLFVSQFSSGGDHYYQLALLPDLLLDKRPPKKVAFVIDHQAGNTHLQSGQVLEAVRSALHARLSDSDSFNIFFAAPAVTAISPNWIPAETDQIDQAIDQLLQTDLAGYSNLIGLLSEVTPWVNQINEPASVIILSSSDQLDDIPSANDFLEDLQALNTYRQSFYPLYYQADNFSPVWVNGQYYWGNEYFYTNLARTSAGQLFLPRDIGSLSTDLRSALSQLGQPLAVFDLQTTLANGLCHSRYTLGDPNRIFPDRSVSQVGKFEGDFPFLVRASASLRGDIRSREYSLGASEVHLADSLCQVAWTGNHLQGLESGGQTNQVISSIIDQSLADRVLSLYTAFLCLEPNQGGEPCLNCTDETQVVGTAEPDAGDSLDIRVLPNPFSDRLTIRLRGGANASDSPISLRISDFTGKVTAELGEHEVAANTWTEVVWIPGSEIQPGMYVLSLTSGKWRKTHKVIYQRP